MNLKQFILIGKAEGISSLILFFVAMPMKYLADFPEAVTYVGMAHGILFIVYVGSALLVGIERKWKLGSFAILAAASVLPGGPLYLDPVVMRREGETA
jgi:integral membrane protein